MGKPSSSTLIEGNIMSLRILFFVVLVFSKLAFFSCWSMDVSDIDTAKRVAQLIVSTVLSNNRTKMDCLVDNVVNDHSLSTHSQGYSYFDTDDRTQISNIIEEVLVNPSTPPIVQMNNNNRYGTIRRRLILVKDFGKEIGYNSAGGSINKAKVCFDITGIDSLTDIGHPNYYGAALTCFPIP